MATRVIAAQDKTSSGAGDDVQIKAGNANTSGAGGSIIIQPGAQATTGGNGLLIVRQPSGVAGTDEIQLSHDGGKGSVINKDGALQLGGANIAIRNSANNANTTVTASTLYVTGVYSNNVQNADGVCSDSYGWAIDGNGPNWNQGFNLRVGWAHIKGYANCGIAYTGDNTNGRRATLEVTDGSTGGGSWAYRSSTTTVNTSYNDLYLSGHSAFQRLNATAATTITGIAPASAAGGVGTPTWIHTDGRIYWLYNIGTFNITLVNESASSTAGNRIITQTGGNVVLGPGRMMQIVYDGTSSRWRTSGETYPYVFPTADGTNGQVLTTNGSGTLSWTTVSAGASASGTTNYIAKFTGASALGSSLIFDNGTHVGIGTTTLNQIGGSRTLSINSNLDAGIELNANNVVSGVVYANTNGLGLSGFGAFGMRFYTASAIAGSAERMRIDASGNVGIGTSSPQSTLDTRGLTILTNSGGNNYNENLRLPESTSGYSVIHMGGAVATSGTGANQWALLKAGSGLSHRFEIRHNTSQFFTITTAGDVGVNTTSPGAKLQVDTGATGTKGQIIKAFLGQSANLSEWQDSTGTVLASIDSAGRMTLAAGAAASNADLYFNNSASVNPAIKWNSVSAQTGLRFYSGSNLIAAIQENGAIRSTSFQTWGGVYLSDFYVQRSGSASISFGASASEAGIEISNGSNSTLGIVSRINTTYSGTKGLVVKGVASQSANLTEWQNNSGTVLASVSSAGQLNLGTATSGSKQMTIASNAGNPGILIYKSPDGSLNSSQLVAAIGTGSSSSNTGTSGGSEYGIINVYHNGTERARLYAYDVGTGQTVNFALDPFAFGANTSLAQVYVTPKTNAIPGIIVRGKASQTANLTEWQDSTGTVVAAVSPTGAFTGSSFTPYGTINSTTTIFGNNYWTPNLSGVSNPSTGTFTKTTATAAWDSQVYSSEGYTKNVYCAARASQTNGAIMFGLNSDPAANASYSSLDYAWYFEGNSNLYIYENNAQIGSNYGTYTTSTVLSITYDGENVRYWKDGVLQRTVARSTGNPLYFDTSFYTLNASLNAVQFGPIGQPFGISGTSGYLPKFTSQQTLGNSIVYDNGTNVGIGTTSTTGKLTVANTGKQLTLKAYDGSQNNTVSFEAIRANYSDAASVLAIYTNSGSSENERVRIMHTGEMGIGTQSPGGMLDVQQSNSGDMLVRAWNTSTAGTGKSILRIANSGNNAQGQQIQFSDNNYYTGTISSDRTNGLAFYVGQMASPLTSERMRIDTSGNVGIGTTSPSAKLDVVGTSLAVGSIMTEVSATYSTASVANSSYALDVYASPSRAHQNQTTYAARIRNSAFNPGGTLYGSNTNGGLFVRCENGNEVGNTSYGIKTEVAAGGSNTYGIHASTSGDSHSVTYGGYFSVSTGPNAYGIYAESSNTGGLRNSYAGAFKISNNVTGNAYGILVDNASITVGGTYYGCYVSIASSTVTGAKAAGIFTDGTNSATFGNGTYSALFAGGNVGIGTTTPGAKLQIDTGATGTKGQIIKAFLGQSANLSEWQDSNGNVLAYVSSNASIIGTPSTCSIGANDNSGGQIQLYGAAQGYGVGIRPTSLGGDVVQVKSGQVSITTGQGGNNAALIVNAYVGSSGSVATFANLGDAASKVIIAKGKASQTGNLQEWQNNGGTALAYMDANGNFAAVTKSFLIPHPTPAKAAEGKKLRYASLEGPENGVYFRGTLTGENEIILPDYWKDLVDPDSITVNLTARKHPQPNLFVVDANAEKVIVESDREICCDFIVYATRKDIAKLEVEIDGNGV